MHCPPDMAASFLRKWQEESTVLVISLTGPRFSVSTGGTVTAFSVNDGIHISLLAVKAPSGEVTAAPGEIMTSFEGASFDYIEPRESPSDIREASEAMFVCLLNIKVPNAETPDFVLTLTEMRNQPEIAES